MFENVPPIEHQSGDHADLSRKSREHSLHAALENVMRIVGEPYDYDFLMGASGHAFRLMIHRSGVYIEPPYDGESHYFRYHTLPAIGYAQKAGSRFCCDGENHPGPLASAVRQSLDRGMPALVCHPFPDWGVIVGHDQDGYAVNTYGGKIIRTPEPEGGWCVLEKVSEITIRESVARSFSIILDYAFRKRMPRGDTTWFDKQYSGIAAYDVWISHLKKNRVKDKFANHWNYATLLDARRAGAAYLERVKEYYSGDARRQIEELSAGVREVVECLHRHLEDFPRVEDVSPHTKGAVKALEELRDLEGGVFTLLKHMGRRRFHPMFGLQSSMIPTASLVSPMRFPGEDTRLLK